MSPLGPDAQRRVRTTWAALAGTDDFPGHGVQVVVNPASRICPQGWAGVVALDDGILATAPDETGAEQLERVVARLAPNDDWSTAFPIAANVRGPAQLAYADGETKPAAAIVDLEQIPADDGDVAAFLSRSPDDDRDEAGIDACTSTLACIRVDGDIVAVAGYRIWLDELAHLSVIVDPRYRNRGYATAVAATATNDALARGLVAQWRARPAASRAVARRLGYVEVGQQVSLLLR